MMTGVILARNEEANIVACLEAFRPHVGELLLIDMESSDRTVELGRSLVDRVLHHSLVANFDAARNIAIAVAKFDWLWFIDADERVSEATGRLVNQLVRERGTEFVALNIPFMTHFCGEPIMHSGWWPGYTMPRVLKRPHFKFSERLHGGVEVDGPQLFLPPDPNLAIQHYSYLSVEHYLAKLNRYTSTEAQQMLADGGEYSWQAAMRHMARDLWMYYEANEGKLDGARGWIGSWV